MLAALTILMCSGFLPTSNALIGFSNEGMLTVMSLMAFAQGLESAGALEILRVMLEFGTNEKTTIQFVLLRLCVISGTISAFLNNTPVVAFFIPVLQEFCAKYKFSPAEVMLPLSYAVILGGTVTTIGTSTNLVATALYATKLNQQYKVTTYNANNVLGLFEMGKIGLPVLLAGIVYIMIVTPLLFAGRRVKPWSPPHVKLYTVSLRVSQGCSLISKAISQTQIPNLSAKLVAHFKDGMSMPSSEAGFPAPDFEAKIEAGDSLAFQCEVYMLPELLRFQGLEFASLANGDHGLFGKKAWHSAIYLDERRLVEVVVGNKSSLVGMAIDDSFRAEHSAIIVAAHRHAHPVLSSTGSTLEAGDSLLVLTNDAFISKYTRDSSFAIVRLVANYKQRRHKYAPLLGSIALVLMIVLSQFLNEKEYGNISILKTALCGIIFLALTGCASQVEMRCASQPSLPHTCMCTHAPT
jgi:di/tricarboxylate transporter